MQRVYVTWHVGYNYFTGLNKDWTHSFTIVFPSTGYKWQWFKLTYFWDRLMVLIESHYLKFANFSC